MLACSDCGASYRQHLNMSSVERRENWLQKWYIKLWISVKPFVWNRVEFKRVEKRLFRKRLATYRVERFL